ncbi:hypothetical protein HDU93_009290 [Gonapodya sp. JEL0774]|nr:hypothetical protein HDU93_009290 [Gonapodya sp. JEL0774]
MPDVPADLTSLFHWGPVLGKGSFATVYLVTDPKDSSLEYAMKVISKKLMRSHDDMEQLRTEINIMKQVDHPRCLRLFNVFESENKVYLQLELARGGELLNLVTKSGRAGVSEGMARAIIESVLQALVFIHSKGIVHRDLKLENVLLHAPVDYLDDDDDEYDWRRYEALADKIGAEVRLGDLGEVGSFAYMAPEVLRSDAYDEKCDLWSVGVITYLLLSGFFPFGAEEQPKAFRNIQEARYFYPQDIWTYISPQARSFIDKLLVVDPKRRLSAEQALLDPWIASERTPRSMTPRPGSRRAASQTPSEPVDEVPAHLKEPEPTGTDPVTTTTSSAPQQLTVHALHTEAAPAPPLQKEPAPTLAIQTSSIVLEPRPTQPALSRPGITLETEGSKSSMNITLEPEASKSSMSTTLQQHRENCQGVAHNLKASVAKQRRFKEGIHEWWEAMHEKLAWDEHEQRSSGAMGIVEHSREQEDLDDKHPLHVIRKTLFGGHEKDKKEEADPHQVSAATAAS